MNTIEKLDTIIVVLGRIAVALEKLSSFNDVEIMEDLE